MNQRLRCKLCGIVTDRIATHTDQRSLDNYILLGLSSARNDNLYQGELAICRGPFYIENVPEA